MLVLNNVSKNYGSKKAIRNINLNIAKGEIFGFLGPNGAGKTTTIKILTGLERPTSGTATIGGFDILENPVEAKRLIGYVADVPFLYELLTGREFLKFILDMWKLDTSDKEEKIDKQLYQLGLLDQGDILIKRYSQGMRQKLALAGALIHEPQLLILDEPLTGVDTIAAKELTHIINEFAQQGGTVFFSTHLMHLVEQLCTKVGFIIEGELNTVSNMVALELTNKKNLEDMFLSMVKETQ